MRVGGLCVSLTPGSLDEVFSADLKDADFVEVRLEPSKNRIRLIPYGVHGRLRWNEMELSPSAVSPSARPEEFVEWSVPLSQSVGLRK